MEAYNATACEVPAGGALSLPSKNGGTLTITVSNDSITVDRTKAVTNCFHDCFKDQTYTVFTGKRSLRGTCKLQIVEDDGYFEIFADDGTILFSVNTY